MAHEVGVERVVGGDEHRERLLTRAPRAPRLLPQARPPPGPARHDDGIQTTHVDAELEGVGRGEPAHRAVTQPALQLPAVLRAGIHRGRPRPRRPGPGRRSRHAVGRSSQGLGARAAPGERDRLHPVEDELGEDLGGLGRGRASVPSWVGGSHSANVIAPRGEPSSVTAATGIPMSRDAWVAGSLTVAEARTNVGVAP